MSKNKQQCDWTITETTLNRPSSPLDDLSGYESYETECGFEFKPFIGSWLSNSYKFCPWCGGGIKITNIEIREEWPEAVGLMNPKKHTPEDQSMAHDILTRLGYEQTEPGKND